MSGPLDCDDWNTSHAATRSGYTCMMNRSGGNRVYALPEFGVAIISENDFRDREAHPKSDRLLAEILTRLALD